MALEVKTHSEVPLLPPHITLHQAKALAATMMQGDPEAASVFKRTTEQVSSALVPGA